MSYCRFGGDSDVYVYPTDDGAECCACLLEDGDTAFYETSAGMLGHLVDHIAAGHKVPAEALQRLIEEMKEEGWV